MMCLPTASAAHGRCAAHRSRWWRGADIRERTVAGAAVPTVLVVVLLGGCATSHIGSEWPCPASQGTPCTSVAVADPARAGEAGLEREQGRLHWTDRNKGIVRTSDSEIGSEPASNRCSRGCRPFAWLRRLAGHATSPSSPAESVHDGESTSAVRLENAPEEIAATGLRPAMQVMDAAGTAAAQTPRTEESIGRIWIAPYVDANGVYHEASWVQAVLKPAGWRLP